MKLCVSALILALGFNAASAGRSLASGSLVPPAFDEGEGRQQPVVTRQASPGRALKKRPLIGGSNPMVTFQPGCFEHGNHIYDEDGNRIRVSNGLWGRPIAYVGKPVMFADGSNSTIPLHKSPDGAAVYAKEDGSGFYYASNSEEGSWEDKEFTGGVAVLEMDNDHNVIDYYWALNGTVNNCAGGRTPWDTWVSCEEEDGYGSCWQVDPANKDQTGPTASARTNITGYPGGWEAFAWDDLDDPPRGYVTDDCEIEDAPLCWGALNRFTPDDAAMECYIGETKAERWCTLNSGTHDYLKLNPYEEGGNCGTISWVDTPEESSAAEFRKSEGIDITDRMMRFVAKKDRLFMEVDLEEQTYCKWSTLEGFPQEPDNIRFLGQNLYFCTDGRTPNGLYGLDTVGYYPLLHEIDYQTELAGADFTPDGKMLYVAFQDTSIWQFWRQDGLPFNATVDKICYKSDDGAVQDIEQVLEPFIKEFAIEAYEDMMEEAAEAAAALNATLEAAVDKTAAPPGRKYKKEKGGE